VIIILTLIAFLLFVYLGRHLLNSLIILENLVLLIYITMVINSFRRNSSISQILVLFVLTVARARVGLSVLVTLARRHGNDLFRRYNLL